MDSFVFDTSSLLYILKIQQYQKLGKNCHILDLTFYEYGNAVLNLLVKRNHKNRPTRDEIKTLLQAYEKISEQLTVLNSAGNKMLDVFELAKKENLTFYDAVYLYYCLFYNFSLVTEDMRLTAAAHKNSISVMDIDGWSRILGAGERRQGQ